jgi:hypothetical protein
MTAEEFAKRQAALLHAIQSGVACEQGLDEGEGVPNAATSPKHLRTGLNAAMVEHAALVRLLIDKGLIAERDYFDAVIRELQAEVARYEERLSARLGAKVTLG